jgi:hypothetical protein
MGRAAERTEYVEGAVRRGGSVNIAKLPELLRKT